jgi:hypothetical protein
MIGDIYLHHEAMEIMVIMMRLMVTTAVMGSQKKFVSIVLALHSNTF